MSELQSHSLLNRQFSSLSQENKTLKDQIIQITLLQETLIQENQKLQQDLINKNNQLVETRLKQQNLQHSLKQVNLLYQNLQSEHSQLFNLVKSQHPFSLRNLYKKQTQMAIDLAQIERKAYREANKSKNEQLTLYQSRIIDQIRENDKMKQQILSMTSEYNEKIYQLKKANWEAQSKLKSLQNLNKKLNHTEKSNIQKQPLQQTIKNMQLELRIQNLTEKVQFYTKQNTELRKRNFSLVQENKKLLQVIKSKQQQMKDRLTESNSQLTRIVSKEGSSLEYIQQMMEENYRMRKQIQDISEKYILLTETYPKLVEDLDTIKELQRNVQRLQKVKHLQSKLSQSQLKQTSLEQSLTHLETKYLNELKARQALEYRSSILTKRFNEIFIKMNPYFNIYQYQALQFREQEYRFFDENKNYKLLKEYEKEVYQLKRELKQKEYQIEKVVNENKINCELKERQLQEVRSCLEEKQKQCTEISIANKVMNEKLERYQLLNIDPQLINERVNEHKLNTEVTVPLLKQMIAKLQAERHQLLKNILQKDALIQEMNSEMQKNFQAYRDPNVQCILVDQRQNLTQEQNGNNQNIHLQINELLKANMTLQQKYTQSITQLTAQIQKLQTQLSNQYDLYQMEIKDYQQQSEEKLNQLNETINNWINVSENFKKVLSEKQSLLKQQQQQLAKYNKLTQQQIHSGVQKGQKHGDNGINQMQLEIQQQQQNVPLQSSVQQDLMRQPSLTNLDKPSTNTFNEESNTKLIGESTVQNLTLTLKKYEQEMNEVLSMCAKLTQQYTELKKQLQAQHQYEELNQNLQLNCNKLQKEIVLLKSTLQQKKNSLKNYQQMYRTKETQCNELKTKFAKQTQSIATSLQDERRKNAILTKELAEIKEKLYQRTSNSDIESISHSQINKSQFETIVVMHANKNKEINHLIQKNKSLENKIETLITQLNTQQTQITQKKTLELSPLQQVEFQQLSHLFSQTNVVDLVKKAHEIIQNQKNKEEQEKRRQIQQEQEKEKQKLKDVVASQGISSNKMINEGQEERKESD